ncbi:MAG: hypothetical protein ACLQFR_14460 [Streptosporangiaceae bacterium]
MQVLVQAAEGLITGVFAFVLGVLWERTRKTFLNYRARKFWRPVMSKDVQLVIGRFRGLQGFEASGVIGAGDALAMYNLHEYFKRIGFGSFNVSYNDQLGYGDAAGESLRTNLILLGGPDANTLTYEVIKRLSLGIAFKEIYPANPDELLEPRVFDPAIAETSPSTNNSRSALIAGRILRRIGVVSSPQWRTPVILDINNQKLYQPLKDGDKILTDCGVIIRAPNPFNPTKTVVILCGSYGYGTWAAVEYAQSRKFLSQVPNRSSAVECVFMVDVVRDTPQRPDPQFVRRSPPSRPPGQGTGVLGSQAAKHTSRKTEAAAKG